MKSIINLTLISSIVLFASCEGNTEYFLNVKNNTSEVVTLVPTVEMSYTNINDTITLAIGESKKIAQWNQRGGNSRSVDITGSVNSIYGVLPSNKLLDSTVYKNNTRWAETIEEKKKRPADYWHYYELTLNDADFQ